MPTQRCGYRFLPFSVNYSCQRGRGCCETEENASRRANASRTAAVGPRLWLCRFTRAVPGRTPPSPGPGHRSASWQTCTSPWARNLRTNERVARVSVECRVSSVECRVWASAVEAKYQQAPSHPSSGSRSASRCTSRAGRSAEYATGCPPDCCCLLLASRLLSGSLSLRSTTAFRLRSPPAVASSSSCSSCSVPVSCLF